MRQGWIVWGVLVVSLLGAGSAAAEVRPFPTRNLQPTVQIFGLPMAEDGAVLAEGRSEGRLLLEVASQYTERDLGDEAILLDGETYRLGLLWRYGFAPGWEAGLELPLVLHGGGGLDGFIEGWHDFFGLPQGGRDEAPSDRLAYRYDRDGSTLLDQTSDSLGLGDLRLLVGRQLWATADNARALALRAELKLPTGDNDRLHGSGAADLSLQLAGRDAATLADLDITLFGSGGVLWLGEGDVLSGSQRHWVGFGSLGLGWQPRSWIALKLQLDGHSAFFHSDLRELGRPTAQLVMGGTLFFGDSWDLDLGVTEDVAVNTAPDVGFLLALSRRF